MNLTSEKITIHCLCLDWFSANLKGKMEWNHELNYKTVDKFTIIFEEFGSKHFENRARVIYDGAEFGEIRFNPRSKIMNPDTIIFKSQNETLYENNFTDYFELFMKSFNLKFSHLSQVDIAADGKGFIKPLILTDNNTIEWVGKGDFQPFKKNTKDGLQYEGFWLGSKKSDKFGRAYYKRRELMRSGKTYIENFWQQNELYEKYGTSDLERLEFRLRNKELSKWFPRVSWKETKKMLDDVNFMASLFNSVSESLFSFREKRKKANVNVSRLKKLFTLNFEIASVYFIEKIINTGAKRMRAIKTSCRTLYEIGLKTNIEFYKRQAVELAQNINHYGWFNKTRLKWEAEYRREMKKGLNYIPIFDGKISSKPNAKFFDEVRQYCIAEEGVIDKLIGFWSNVKYSF